LPNKRRKKQLPAARAGETAATAAAAATVAAADDSCVGGDDGAAVAAATADDSRVGGDDGAAAVAEDSGVGGDDGAAAVAVSAGARGKIAIVYVSAPFEPSDKALARVPPRLLTAVQDQVGKRYIGKRKTSSFGPSAALRAAVNLHRHPVHPEGFDVDRALRNLPVPCEALVRLVGIAAFPPEQWRIGAVCPPCVWLEGDVTVARWLLEMEAAFMQRHRTVRPWQFPVLDLSSLVNKNWTFHMPDWRLYILSTVHDVLSLMAHGTLAVDAEADPVTGIPLDKLYSIGALLVHGRDLEEFKYVHQQIARSRRNGSANHLPPASHTGAAARFKLVQQYITRSGHLPRSSDQQICSREALRSYVFFKDVHRAAIRQAGGSRSFFRLSVEDAGNLSWNAPLGAVRNVRRMYETNFSCRHTHELDSICPSSQLYALHKHVARHNRMSRLGHLRTFQTYMYKRWGRAMAAAGGGVMFYRLSVSEAAALTWDAEDGDEDADGDDAEEEAEDEDEEEAEEGDGEDDEDGDGEEAEDSGEGHTRRHRWSTPPRTRGGGRPRARAQ